MRLDIIIQECSNQTKKHGRNFFIDDFCIIIICVFFLIIIFLPNQHIFSSVVHGEDNQPFHWDWLTDRTIRVPETISMTALPEIDVRNRSIDSSIGPDDSAYIVWESMENIFFSHRLPGTIGFTIPFKLNSPEDSGIAPKIYVSDDGIIHVVWLSGGNISKRDSMSPSRDYLIWEYSLDGGINWSSPIRILTGNFSYPDLTVLSDGNISITMWNQYRIISPNGTIESNGYRLIFIAWSLEGIFASKTIVTDSYPEPIPHQYLFLSGNGNPQILVSENNELNWYGSSDNGRSWTILLNRKIWPVPGLLPGCLLGGITLTDDCLIFLIGFQDAINSSRFYLGFVVDFYDWGGGIEATPWSEWISEYNFSMCMPICSFQFRHNNAWLVQAIIRPDTEIANSSFCSIILGNFWLNKPHSLDLGYTWKEIGRIRIGENISSNIARILGLSISIEPNGIPVIVLSNSNASGSSTTINVWRFNHAPIIPESETVIDGGWFFTNFVQLSVKPTIDIDGDGVEYRFNYWNEEKTISINSNWMKRTSLKIIIPSGTYHWSIEVRDTFNYSDCSTEDWWFRVDTNPPTACAGGPYVFTEGSFNFLDGGGSYGNGPLRSWEWDVNNDGIFELSTFKSKILWMAEDDYSGLLILRVTDEAGLTAISRAKLVVLNVPPTISIEGPLVVVDTGNFIAHVSDPSLDDTVSVRWCVNGRLSGYGLDFHFISNGPGTYSISAMAVDDDGGSSYTIINITVPWPGKIPFSIAIPRTVREGHQYFVKISNPIPNWITPQEIVWRRLGSDIGRGMEVRMTAGTPGKEKIEVGIYIKNAFILGNSTSIQVTENLHPTICTKVNVQSNNTIQICWTKSTQSEMFDKYIIRLSPEPLPVQPNSDLGWMLSKKNDLYFEESRRSMIEHEFTGLNASWTYHICIYTVGDDEVVCSPSVYVAIPPIEDTMGADHSQNGTGDKGWEAFMGLAIVIVVSISAITIHQRIKDKNRI